MKRFTVPCMFAEVSHPFHVYVGAPSSFLHPLHFQEAWLREMRGGVVPHDVMESFAKLRKISVENDVSFEELCVYALGEANTTSNSAPESSTSENDQETQDGAECETVLVKP